jgi:hypothetical protein
MLPTKIVLEIRRLLDDGRLSRRQIARRLGVSRGVVAAIATGRRGLFGREPGLPPPARPQPIYAAARCRGCGGMVYHPCRLCAVRASRRREATLRALQKPAASKAASSPQAPFPSVNFQAGSPDSQQADIRTQLPR